MRSEEFTKQRMAWLEAVASDQAVQPLGVRCAIVLATQYVHRGKALQSGELWAWPSQTTLAAKVGGATRNGIFKATASLKAAGHLRIVPGQGRVRHTCYQLLFRARSAREQLPERPDLGDENEYAGIRLDGSKRDTGVPQKEYAGHSKTNTPVGPTPVKDSFERTPASRRSEEDGLKEVVERIYAALPLRPKEQSSTEEVRQAVEAIVQAGVKPAVLALAVERFCAEAETAKSESGRYMGAAHTWLAKRRWEAHLPSVDDLFLDGRRKDAPWLWRVRSWQRTGSWDKYEHGPAPGDELCKAPSDVIEHCNRVPMPPAPKRSSVGWC